MAVKANGLNIYTYLEYLFLYMPDTDWRNHPELLDDLMPWSGYVQEECKKQYSGLAMITDPVFS